MRVSAILSAILFSLTSIEHVQRVHYSVITAAKYNHELFDGHSFVAMPGLRSWPSSR